jgi:hypothetical protein
MIDKKVIFQDLTPNSLAGGGRKQCSGLCPEKSVKTVWATGREDVTLNFLKPDGFTCAGVIL